MNFLKKHDIVLKLVALLVAVFMWSYVVVLKNPAKVVKFPGVAIEMTGVSQLEERGLMLVPSCWASGWARCPARCWR